MLAAIGAEPRLRITQLLLTAHPVGMAAGEIRQEPGISASKLSHHLEKLKNQGVIDLMWEGSFLLHGKHEGLQDLLTFLFSECCARTNGVRRLLSGTRPSTVRLEAIAEEQRGASGANLWHDVGVPRSSRRSRELYVTCASLAAAALLGFYAKRGYHGPASVWIANSVGGIFYVIFWCLVLVLLLSRARASRIVFAVLTATCILEFLQLWHPPLLETARRNFLGRTVLGSYFDWSDFPYYFIGAALAWLWLRAVGRR